MHRSPSIRRVEAEGLRFDHIGRLSGSAELRERAAIPVEEFDIDVSDRVGAVMPAVGATGERRMPTDERDADSPLFDPASRPPPAVSN